MMKETDQMKIRLLRMKGKGYSEIAREMSMKPSTVRMFCLRHGVTNKLPVPVCVCCGQQVTQHRKGQKKVYCSERCRSAYRRLTGVLREPTYHHVCENCGIAFDTSGNKKQKYCSVKCFQASRKDGQHERVLS